MTIWRKIPVCVGLAMALGTFGAAEATAQRIIVANDTGPSSLKGRTWDKFKEFAAEEIGDKVPVEVTHSGALYDQKQVVGALQLGAIQFTSPTVGVYSGTFPKLSVLVLPYLLPSPEAIREAVEDPEIGGVLFEEMRQKGVEPLAIWLNGPRDIGTTAAKPILEPGDVKGVKVRVPPGANYVEAFKVLGANVTTLSWSEVPAALRQGVIDAVEPVPNAWLSSRLHETAKQITRIGYIWDFYIVATNKAWWDGLPADTRDGLKRAMDRATAWNWENTNQANDAAYETMAKEGATIHELTPEQRRAWAEAVKPVWSQLGDKLVGAKVMQKLARIGDKHR